jgi:hypothetical protein
MFGNDVNGDCAIAARAHLTLRFELIEQGSVKMITAFAQINAHNHAEVRAAVYLLTAAYIGVALPNSAKAQIQAGQPWDVTTGPDAAPNSWGGHCVMIRGK